jgi:hypothetical protein
MYMVGIRGMGRHKQVTLWGFLVMVVPQGWGWVGMLSGVWGSVVYRIYRIPCMSDINEYLESIAKFSYAILQMLG